MATQRKGEYFHKELSVLNLATTPYPAISVVGVRKNAGPGGTDIVTEETGHAFVPKTPEMFQHDPDGNLTQDGRWIYTWDAENRLVAVESRTGILPVAVPRQRLEFAYDHMSRRVSKKVYTWDAVSDLWLLTSDVLFVYDGWNLIAELTEVSGQMSVVRSHVWGLDLSQSLQGAGGVGGLLFGTFGWSSSTSTLAYAFDGNGNVSALLDMQTGTIAATYEYDPFGNTLSATGPAAEANVLRFSTKYTDVETGLLYYGYRYYQPSTGRWLSRDPIGESGGVNLFLFVLNNGLLYVDKDGLFTVGPLPPWVAELAPKLIESTPKVGPHIGGFVDPVISIDPTEKPYGLPKEIYPYPLEWKEKEDKTKQKLYRSMKGDLHPETGDDSSRKLGIRWYADSKQPSDVEIVMNGCNEMVNPTASSGIAQGLSVSESIFTMGAPQLPNFLGGKSKDPVWWIYVSDLPPSLKYTRAPTANPNHGIIGPAFTMPLHVFRGHIKWTQQHWHKQLWITIKGGMT
jgi:RHS repeat-associated protein